MNSKKRELHLPQSFKRSLTKLARKYQSLPGAVEEHLNRVVLRGPTWRCKRVEGVDGEPVFKIRLRLDGVGRRGGARLIYYCSDKRVVGLLIFTKNERGNVSSEEIQSAMNRIEQTKWG